jgi:hypothetical protein
MKEGALGKEGGHRAPAANGYQDSRAANGYQDSGGGYQDSGPNESSS